MEAAHEPAARADDPALPPRRRWDRHFWLVTVLAACVILPRAAMVSLTHNESVDDDYHLRRGLMFWTGVDVALPMSNPPLGGAISALPLYLLGSGQSGPNPDALPAGDLAPLGMRPGRENPLLPPDRLASARAARPGALYGQPVPPHLLLLAVALWKALLYVPLIPLVFSWCRQVHGPASGWMAAVLLTFEPNLAAHIHSPSLDVIGVEAVIIACYVCWRFARTPTVRWLLATAAVAAAAMLVKHLAMFLPFVLLVFLAVDAVARRRPMRGVHLWRSRFRLAALAVVTWALTLWALTGFDVSVPNEVGGASPWVATRDAPRWKHAVIDLIDANLTRPLPAGQYIGSTFLILKFNNYGHWGYLFGEHRIRGWWYYYPTIASYKVPIGIGVLALLTLASVWWVRPKVDELALLVPYLVWGTMLFGANMNVGIRHAMPAYAFGMLLATRVAAAAAPKWMRLTAWAGVAAAAVHGLSYHPNYGAYLNFPRERAYLHINDSNVDWGQSIQPVAKWLDDNREMIGDRPVYLRPFGDDQALATNWYLKGRVHHLALGADQPTTGLLIVSPVHVVGMFDEEQRYLELGHFAPDAIIADTMLVYDMDKLHAAGFRWPRPRTRATFTDMVFP